MLKEYFNSITFEWPWVLPLLVAVPLLWWLARRRENRVVVGMRFTSTAALSQFKNTRVKLQWLPYLFRMIAVAAMIVALARPVTKNTLELTEGQGIDIMLCLDVSGSMLAQDFQPNRLEAARNVALDFIDRRKGDRIGLVIFSGESFTLCPLTSDKNILKQQVNSFQNGVLMDGTAIGSGLASSVDRLKNSDAKSKVVILLTDGENTGGLIDPQTAKELAKTFSIKVYTIGVGTTGYAPMPYQTPMGPQTVNEKVSIDEALLTQIADETGGKYFRATDGNQLMNIYAEIDKLEKSKVESTSFTKKEEKFYPWVMAAIIALMIELVMRFVFFRKFP